MTKENIVDEISAQLRVKRKHVQQVVQRTLDSVIQILAAERRLEHLLFLH